jgi:catechol 2,3-dioxygenase-like lactoylglutathione lyase family enzyme
MSPDAPAGTIVGLDHVALPMQDPHATTAFYRALGLEVTENDYLVQVYIGNQMINFHRSEVWQQPDFSLRAPAARPPCGDLCFVWVGPAAGLTELLDRAGARVEEGPVERHGGRQSVGTSVYVRDPDGNLLEFLSYAEDGSHAG